MSYSYERVERRTTNNPGRSASSYGHSGRRSVLGYWLPLALTVTAATVGLVAWVWSERKDDEDDSSVDEQYNSGGMPPPPGNMQMGGGLPPGQGQGGFQGGPPQGPGMPPPGNYDMGAPPMQGGFVGGPPPPQGGFGPGGPMSGPPAQGGFRSVGADQGTSTGVDVMQSQTESTWVSRMTTAVGLGNNDTANWAGNNLAAGVAAAGAMVGINSIVGGNEQQQQQQQQQLQSTDYYNDQRTTTTTTEQTSTEQVSMRDTAQGEIEPKMGVKRSGTADEFFSGAVELPKRTSLRAAKRKTVAIVVSAVEHHEDMGDMDVGDHASILSHLPSSIDTSTTRIFVLIYAPSLQTHPISAVAATNRRGSLSANKSLASSFSNISQTDAQQTPGDFPQDSYTGNGNPSRSPTLTALDPQPLSSSSNPNPNPNLSTTSLTIPTTTLYKTLHNQSLPLVASDSETQILPFTTARGHLHILRSLAPEIVYIQESLTASSESDAEGSIVSELSGWVRNVVVVIGDEGGHGGLVDSDDEDATAKEQDSGKWWQREERTGVGRGVSVVESVKIGDDWRRRVAGLE